MKIILTNKERLEMDRYIKATHALNNKIAKAINEEVPSMPKNTKDFINGARVIGATVT